MTVARYLLILTLFAILQVCLSQGSQFSGQWTFQSCTPSTSTTCTNYPPVPETYFVADTLQGVLYAVPYSNVVGPVTALSYSGSTISFPSSCAGTWNSNQVSATCSDGSSLQFTCNAGPCRSTPTAASTNLVGQWSQTGYCKSFNSLCSTFFDTTYSVTVSGQQLTLQPSSSSYGTATLQAYSDGSAMIASPYTLCYSRTSPVSNYYMRVICGYPSGAWAEVDFKCTSGSCVGKPLTNFAISKTFVSILSIVLVIATVLVMN
jgi:hypothetical protein